MSKGRGWEGEQADIYRDGDTGGWRERNEVGKGWWWVERRWKGGPCADALLYVPPRVGMAWVFGRDRVGMGSVETARAKGGGAEDREGAR